MQKGSLKRYLLILRFSVGHTQLVESFFHRLAADIEPALQEVGSEHPLQLRRGPSFPGLRVEGFYEGIESLQSGLLVFFEGGGGFSKSSLTLHRSQLLGLEWM